MLRSWNSSRTIVRESAEQRILLEARGQDALGDDQQARVGGEAALEAHVPPHLAAECPALLVRDAPRHGARGDAPRLQHEHAAGVDQRRRHARGLARARRGNQHRCAPRSQNAPELGDGGLDGQCVERHGWRVYTAASCASPLARPAEKPL